MQVLGFNYIENILFNMYEQLLFNLIMKTFFFNTNINFNVTEIRFEKYFYQKNVPSTVKKKKNNKS